MTRQPLNVSCVFVVLMACCLTACAADRVERKSSSAPLTGTITKISRDAITMTVGSVKKTESIAANDIVRVRWDGEPAKLNLLRADERLGRLEKAQAGYNEVLDSLPVTARNLRTDLEFLILRTAAKMAVSDPDKLNRAVVKLEAFRTSHKNHFRYFEALDHLGRLYVAQKQFSLAQEVYTQLQKAPWPETQLFARIAAARVRMNIGDATVALADFEAAIPNVKATSNIAPTSAFSFMSNPLAGGGETLMRLVTPSRAQMQGGATSAMSVKIGPDARHHSASAIAQRRGSPRPVRSPLSGSIQMPSNDPIPQFHWFTGCTGRPRATAASRTSSSRSTSTAGKLPAAP